VRFHRQRLAITKAELQLFTAMAQGYRLGALMMQFQQ
jgi:hypothetical protein